MQTLFWHDYETFGANPQKDRPSQFAGVRTDLDLNIVSEPVTVFCKPTEDFLPSPDACLITGITPQIALEKGVSEAEFANQIYRLFSVPGTCVAGYNSIRFDDEVSRNLFYRNFYDPYEREWKNGNSRWDIIDVVRFAYALRPEGIRWPKDEMGNVSFRLERLTEENNIEHLSAHDAMSDVYATIAVAKLIKQAQPELYDYAFRHKDKTKLAALIDYKTHKPLFHVSSKFPVSKGCSALVAPIAAHPTNKNGVVVFDLRQDPTLLLDLSVEEIRQRMYTRADELGELERPAIKLVHLNKCPMLGPASLIKTIPPERIEAWGMPMEQMLSNLELIRKHPDLAAKLTQVFSEDHDDIGETDPDLMIYKGGFFGSADKSEMARVRASDEQALYETQFQFNDPRLPEMLFRYKARNFPASLSETEQDRWSRHCASRILNKDSAYLSLEPFLARLAELEKHSLSEPERHIIEELKYYVESIVPYY